MRSCANCLADNETRLFPNGLLRTVMLTLLGLMTGSALAEDISEHPCLQGNAASSAIDVGSPTSKGLFPGPSNTFYTLADTSGGWSSLHKERDLTANAKFHAYPAGPANRWGFIPAWIVQADGPDRKHRLLQEHLVARGLTALDPRLGSWACTQHLIEAEDRARKDKSGLWQTRKIFSSYYAEPLVQAAGQHVIVEGRIVSLGKTERTRYLNFGRYWKTDFTATISASHEDAFRIALLRQGLDWKDLSGQAVRLRGVIEVQDGPLLRLVHPGQLTILDREEDRK
ncbi:hypothetical protein [Labrenzia sp. CE80]|uniref:hypothetical protein n=1 Tax=Labrenzia sp. CE80 TaxID=1788986 RepID=UPI00129B94FD|nr:hypothetical protein [Labrenzia sp. CE80]